MKRSFRVALLATVATVAAGMAFADDLVTKERAGKADAPNTLTLRLTGDGPGNTNPVFAEGYTKLFAEFIAKHPDWKIEFQRMSDNIGQEQARLLEQAKSGQAPDCAAVDSFQLALFKTNKVMKPMTPYFTKDEVADLFPFVREGVTGSDGEIYAWWWGTDLRVLYRNKEMVPTAPQTWDELKAAALATVQKGQEGVLFNGGRWEGTVFDWLANYWAQGGELVDKDGKPIFAEGDNRTKILKAINYYKDLVDSGAAPKRVATIVNYDDFNAAAAAGTASLFIGGNWQLHQLETTLEPEEFAKWTFSPIPGPTLDQRSTGTGGWTLAAFSDDPKKVEFCALIAKDVYAGPVQAMVQGLPTAKAIYGQFDAFKTPAMQEFAAALEHGKARPGVPIYPEISNQMQIMMGDVLTGTKTPEAALDAANAAVQAAYSRL